VKIHRSISCTIEFSKFICAVAIDIITVSASFCQKLRVVVLRQPCYLRGTIPSKTSTAAVLITLTPRACLCGMLYAIHAFHEVRLRMSRARGIDFHFGKPCLRHCKEFSDANYTIEFSVFFCIVPSCSQLSGVI